MKSMDLIDAETWCLRAPEGTRERAAVDTYNRATETQDTTQVKIAVEHLLEVAAAFRDRCVPYIASEIRSKDESYILCSTPIAAPAIRRTA